MIIWDFRIILFFVIWEWESGDKGDEFGGRIFKCFVMFYYDLIMT